ncbi:hypothetical protein D3C81_1198090 [compost metagenome]
MAEAQAIMGGHLPVQFALDALEAQVIVVARGEIVHLERLADQVADLVVEQFDVEVEAEFGEAAVVAQFPRAHALLLEIAGSAGAGEVARLALAESARTQVAHAVLPVDMVLEHVRRAHRFGIHRAQTVGRGEQVVEGDARRQRAADRIVILEHGATLQQPVWVDMPLELAEQAPGVLAARAVEVDLRIGPVVAVAQATDQAQAVGQAEGVLDFQVEAVLAHIFVDQAAAVRQGPG